MHIALLKADVGTHLCCMRAEPEVGAPCARAACVCNTRPAGAGATWIDHVCNKLRTHAKVSHAGTWIRTDSGSASSFVPTTIPQSISAPQLCRELLLLTPLAQAPTLADDQRRRLRCCSTGASSQFTTWVLLTGFSDLVSGRESLAMGRACTRMAQQLAPRTEVAVSACSEIQNLIVHRGTC